MSKTAGQPIDAPAKKREPVTYIIERWEQDENEPETSGTWRQVGEYPALSRKAAAKLYIDGYHGGSPPQGLRIKVYAESAAEEFAPTLIQQPRLVW